MQQSQVTVVLDQAQRNVNIGGAIRAILNTGFRQLTLVQPREYDPVQLADLAHRYEDLLVPIQIYEDLESALQGVHTVVGFTARQRGERSVESWDELAPRLGARSSLALLFGREDRGLSNAALERCTFVAALPVAADYPSLNLASAVLLALYELRRTSALPSTSAADPPAQAVYDQTLALAEQALDYVHFHRTPGHKRSTLRILRHLLTRAEPSQAELQLLQALAYRVLKRPGSPRNKS